MEALKIKSSDGKSVHNATNQNQGFDDYEDKQKVVNIKAHSNAGRNSRFDDGEDEESNAVNLISYKVEDKYEKNEEPNLRFSDIYPVEQKNIKSNSLEFDIKLGWMPRAQITGPIPLAFAHPDMDDLLEEHTPHEQLIYLGPRPTNSFEAHRSFYENGQKYPFNQFHLCKSQFLQRFFRKYYPDYEFNSSRKEGMVRKDSALIFSSNFEGGNLDAVYFAQGEYKLVLRVDTNTQGHCNYFYFK